LVVEAGRLSMYTQSLTMLLFVYITQIPDLLLSELPLQETVSNTVFLVPETGRVFICQFYRENIK